MNSAPPVPSAPASPRPAAAESADNIRPLTTRVPGGRFLAVFLGVFLPLFALGFELSTGLARDFRDPIPTLAHAFLIALVPLAHFAALLAVGKSRRRPSLAFAAHLNSAALAIGVAYSLFFATITPFAVIAIIAMGLGLLPLSPLFSVIAANCLRAALRNRARADGTRLPSFWPGFLAACLVLAALEAPSFVTCQAVEQLSRGTTSEQNAALARLRAIAPLGGETQLLRGAYALPRAGLLADQAGAPWRDDSVRDAEIQEAYRLAYYRVTGRAFNSVPAPRRSAFAVRDRSDPEGTREWVWDDSLGAQQVGRRLRALNLTESRLDARLEGDAALGYVEWTLVFRNDHAFDQREARALIQLPPGAAVSRLTLWVNGEEREAAWGGPSQVVQAYRSVAVVQRRDPVLVTAQGPDRVLLQCFPIEPRGGRMKVRLGVTVPLALASAERAHLLLPRFIEQNFSLADSVAHQFRAEADAPLTPGFPSLVAEADLVRPALRGKLSSVELASGVAPLSVARDPTATFAWTPALRDPTRLVTQAIRQEAPHSGETALLVSGSAELAPAASALAAALRRAKSTPFVRIHHSGDEAAESAPGLDAAAQADWLDAHRFTGGQDDTRALAAALDALAARGGGTLVWVHGGQPISWQETAILEQRLTRHAGRVKIVSVPAVAAPNILLDKAAAAAPVATFPRLAGYDADFDRLLRELREGKLVAARASLPATAVTPSGKRASDQLSRLWARDETHRLLENGDAAARQLAQRLAVSSQIVTPVSGAVVLETDAQYKASGLDAPDPDKSPAVPEPAAYGLFMSGALLAFSLLRRRPRQLSVNIPAR